MRWFLLATTAIPIAAFGQAVPNGGPILPGQAWTVPQWNGAWKSKVDGSYGICNTCTLISPAIAGLLNGGLPPSAPLIGSDSTGTGAPIQIGSGLTIVAGNTLTSTGGGAGSGTVAASPQYRIGAFLNAGTTAVVAGTPTVTTDGSGNLNVNNLLNAGSIASTGSVSGVGITDTGTTVLNNSTLTVAPGTTQGGAVIVNIQDPSTLPTNSRPNESYTTLNFANQGSHAFEDMFHQVTVNGPGKFNAELNIIHPVMINNGTMSTGENFEASNSNNGTITQWTDYLALFHNNASGTVTSSVTMFNGSVQNDNTATPILQEFIFSCGAEGGSGLPATFKFCLSNTDANQQIRTLGQVMIGELTPSLSSAMLSIKSQGTLANSFPFVVDNAAGVHDIIVTDTGNFTASGNMTAAGQLLSGTVGGPAGGIKIFGTTAGQIQLSPNTQNIGGSFIINIPATQTDTMGLIGTAQTWTANNVYSSAWSIGAAGTGVINGVLNYLGTGKYGNLTDYIDTAPTATGFAATVSIPTANGNKTFQINLGSTPTSTGTLTFPAGPTHANICHIVSQANSATESIEAVPTSATTVVVTNYVRTTGVAGNFTAGETLYATCGAF